MHAGRKRFSSLCAHPASPGALASLGASRKAGLCVSNVRRTGCVRPRENAEKILSRRRRIVGLVPLVFLLALARTAYAAGDSVIGPRDISRNPEWFPRFYRPYLRLPLEAPDFTNSARVSRWNQNGTIRLSMTELLSAVVENNLDLVSSKSFRPIAESDVLRAKAGQAPRGFEGASIPSGLFTGAIGAGLGQAAGGAGGIGGGGGITGNARAVFISPRGTFDPSFTLNFSQDRATSPLNTVRVSGIPVVTGPTAFLQGSYQQAFTTGTSFSVSLSNQRQSSTQQFLLYNPALVSRFSFSFTQQILNGFGFAVQRRFLDLAKNNRVIAQEILRQNAIATVALAQSMYWDLAGSRENLRAAQESLAVAEKLLADTRVRVTIGNASDLDVISSESEAASRRRDLIAAQTDFQTKELALKSVLSRKMDADLAAARIEITDTLPEPWASDLPKFQEAVERAYKNRPELKQGELSIQSEGIVVRFTRNSMKPTLTLFGLFASSGLYGDRTIPNPDGPPIVLPGGLAQSLRQVARGSFPEYAVGFALSIPLRNRAAQADNVRARLEQRQSEVQLRRTRTTIELEVRRAIIGIEQSRAQAEAARKALDLTRQILEAEGIKLQEGISSPYRLTQLQRDLIAAQRADVEARVSYVKAVVELSRATGETLEKNHITMDDILR